MNTGSDLAHVEVRRWTTLRRTQLTLVGEVDGDAVRELAERLDEAELEGDDVSLDVSEITCVRREALADLLALARAPSAVL